MLTAWATYAPQDAYQAVDLGMEGSLVMGMLGGYVTGMLSGILISIPAMFNQELMSMLLFAAAGVMGGLLRDLAPDKEFIWKFTPDPTLASIRLLRRGDLRLAGFSIACVGMIALAEVLRHTMASRFPNRRSLRATGRWLERRTLGARGSLRHDGVLNDGSAHQDLEQQPQRESGWSSSNFA